MHDHNCDRAPKSFSYSEKFIAAVQACNAQKHPLFATLIGLGRLNFPLCDLPHIENGKDLRMWQ